jgi:hypothetical protein
MKNRTRLETVLKSDRVWKVLWNVINVITAQCPLLSDSYIM